jgi:hypothetical protein
MNDRLQRIAEIDASFEAATRWGSWMVEASNERARLVKLLQLEGHAIEHKWMGRSGTGGRVS